MIKNLFTSRMPGGWLIEVDYSQLEIYILAYLTQCPKLQGDLRSGKDLHTMRAAELAGIPYEEYLSGVESGKATFVAGRKLAKALSFQLQYGSGPTNMAEELNIPVTLAKTFIKNYYARYPEIKEWQTALLNAVKARRTPPRGPLERATSTVQSRTGRFFVFDEYPGNEKYGPGFMPPEVKNYLVQGLATGDIVPHMLGVLNQALPAGHLIGTLHDSFLIDSKTSNKDNALKLAKLVNVVLTRTSKEVNETFGLSLDFELPFEISMGKSWGGMEPVVLSEDKIWI